MQKHDNNITITTVSQFSGKPSIPLTGRQSFPENKVKDPSSSPKVERYPVPPVNNRMVQYID
jgi:hypothetical protein